MINYSANGIPIENKSTNGGIPLTTGSATPVAKIPTIPAIKGGLSSVMNDTSTPATKAGTIPANGASTTPVSITSSTPATTTSTLPVTKASAAPVTKSSTIPVIKTSATPVTKDGSTVVGDPKPTTETSKSNCCSFFAADGIDELLDTKGPQINFVRVTASLCLLFGLTEIAVGSAVYDYVTYPRTGAWWSALVVLIAG